MVKEFYGLLGFEKVSEEEKATVWRFQLPDEYINRNQVIRII